MKRVLIAGSSGLLGSSLIAYLHDNCKDLYSSCIFTLRPTSSATSYHSSSNTRIVNDLSLHQEWIVLLQQLKPDTICLISNVRHSSALLSCLSLPEFHGYSPRLVIVGTTGVHSTYKAYSSVYKKLECLISQYTGSFLVLRPSMIFGASNDRNVSKALNFIRKYRFYPIFGNGDYLMQPVHYSDVAAAIVSGLLDESLCGFYNIPGRYPITYNAFVENLFLSLLINPRVVRIPRDLFLLFLRLCPRSLASFIPVTTEQVYRINENKAFPYTDAVIDFDYCPLSFEDGLSLQVYAPSSLGMPLL